MAALSGHRVIMIIFARKATSRKARNYLGRFFMRKEYDFSKAGPNPYAKRLKKTITIRIDDTSLDYFKRMSQETGHSLSNADQHVPSRLC
jgi:uncharacterized protein (DUF4415 family)